MIKLNLDASFCRLVYVSTTSVCFLPTISKWSANPRIRTIHIFSVIDVSMRARLIAPSKTTLNKRVVSASPCHRPSFVTNGSDTSIPILIRLSWTLVAQCRWISGKRGLWTPCRWDMMRLHRGHPFLEQSNVYRVKIFKMLYLSINFTIFQLTSHRCTSLNKISNFTHTLTLTSTPKSIT